MVGPIRRQHDRRARYKCSACRKKKIKCLPRDRIWNTVTQQKCDNCQKHDDDPCGPNITPEDDRASSGSPYHQASARDDSVQKTRYEPRTPACHPTGALHGKLYVGGGDEERPSVVAGKSKDLVKDLDLDKVLISVEEKLRILHSYGKAYEFISQLPPARCHNPNHSLVYNDTLDQTRDALRKVFHELFKEIVGLGVQLSERGKNSDTKTMFLDLLVRLGCYPGLADDRIIESLLKMAQFFIDMKHEDASEVVLIKIDEIRTSPGNQQNIDQRLANSLTSTSQRTDQDLDKLLVDRHFNSEETSLAVQPALRFALPPIQRSAQLKSPGVLEILLRPSNSIKSSPPALFNREGLQLAATHGFEQHLVKLLEAGAEVDARDRLGHTALFLAAEKGHVGCCARLIEKGADVNCRDFHGTPILEVVAGAGHLKVVQLLVEAEAVVNPDLLCCSSSPLEAAIENPKSPLEIAYYLLDHGSEITEKAIESADERHEPLANRMRSTRQMPMPRRQSFFGPS